MMKGILSALAVLSDLDGAKPSRPGPYFIRPGSDKEPEWKFWFVCDASGFNVLGRLSNLAAIARKCDELNGVTNG